MGKKKAKSSKATKVSKGHAEDAGSPKKIKLTKRKRTSEKIFSEQELQNVIGQMSDLILAELPKTEESLLNDYDKSEFILIDGDSMFITCASDVTLQQGQNLHFFYLVECFLLDLTSKGTKYIIVFFQDAECVYYENPYLLSLRTALIFHLINNTNIAVQTEFSNCLDDNWQDFLRKTSPYFLIISDEGLNQLQTIFFHILIIHALFNKMRVVLTSGQESDATKMYGYHIHGRQGHGQFFKEHKVKIKQYLKNELEHWKKTGMEVLLSSCPGDMVQKIALKISSILDGKNDIRYIVCIGSCLLLLETYKKELRSQIATRNQKTGLLKWQEATDLIRMYCLSVAFLHHLPFSQRAQVRFIRNDWKMKTSVLIHQHKVCEFHILKYLIHKTQPNLDISTLPDLSDNLIWKNIVYYYEVDSGPELDLYLKSNIHRDYEYLWESISALSASLDIGASSPVRITSTCFLTRKCLPDKEDASKMAVPNLGLLPMDCTIMDEFAGDILNELPFLKSDDPAVISLLKKKKVKKCLCWHSRRPVSDDYDGAAKDRWALHDDPELQPSQCIYGEFQEGFMSHKTDSELDNPEMSWTVVKKNKKAHKTKPEIIAVDKQKKKKAENLNKEESQWDDFSVSLEREMPEDCNSEITNSKLKTLELQFQNKSVKCEVQMAVLNACFERWRKHCDDKGKTCKDLNLAVEVMRRIHSLLANYQDILKDADYHEIIKYLGHLGFDNLIASSEHTRVPRKRKDGFKKKHATYAVGIRSSRFQLQYMSQYLIREKNKPDPRVQDFIPDIWQRDILDLVDNNESAVIVAPTSSGKSYVSYYCMEKILRDHDEGVVVYVAPTQAVVNQVKATIHSRFDKTLPVGLFSCGVLTQGNSCTVLNCQIIVTMPHYFEALLLSPYHQNWAKKIRYVILDEVCYNAVDYLSEGWEHLLLIIQCPFLVLSATMNNPEHFVEWLQSVKIYWKKPAKIPVMQNPVPTTSASQTKKLAKEENKRYRVKLVIHNERYNDLEKYVCSVKKDDITICHYHPYAALTVDHIEKYGFPVDLSLSPRETLLLYDTMLSVRKRWPRAHELDPEEFVSFKDKTVITKAAVKYYEEELKNELEMWIQKKYKEEVTTVLRKLKPPCSSCFENQMRDSFPCFVEKLRQMDKLPAVFFIRITQCTSTQTEVSLTSVGLTPRFSIKKAEELAKSVFSFLEEKERGASFPDTAKQDDKCLKTKQTDDMKASCNKNKTLVRKVEPGNVMKQPEEISETPAAYTYANYQALDIKAVHEIFHHARLTTKHEVLQKLALKGIGYHHAFVEPKGKQSVENLFTKGFIQVVTATGSLGLGINAPCKSVVFVQNSEYLDPMMYRWMSGHAGQRGHHFLGNVYFFNIPLSKIERLIKSDVPQIQGQFLLGVSLILKLMLFISKAEDKASARKKVLSLLKNSLLSFEQRSALKILKLYFLFSLQFLVKLGYMDQEGHTMGFSGLVTHLPCHEPFNFVFVDFLVKDLFHTLCLPSQRGKIVFSEDVMEKLVLILAHLFGRKYLPAAILKSKQKFSQSKVFLEELPKEFAVALDLYNCNVKENFGQFLLSVSKLHNKAKSYHLPLSKLDFSNKEQHDSLLASRVMCCDQERTAVSPFVCLSGNSDFDLLHRGALNNVLLHTLGIPVSKIPVLCEKKCDKQGRRMLLNAYLLDFYRHGSLAAISKENGLNEGEAYRLLKEFAHHIQAISISLREFCDSSHRSIMLAFQQLSHSYWRKLESV